MNGFKAKLDAATASLGKKFDSAIGTSDMPQRLDQLLALKEEADEKLGTLERRQDAKAAASTMLGILAAFPVFFMVAPLAATAPLTFFGLLALPVLTGFGICAAFGINNVEAMERKHQFAQKINAQISTLIAEDPALAITSPRLLAHLAQSFNPEAANVGAKTPETAAARAQQTAAPAPKKIYLE